jgi:hypothetical protein
MLQMKEEIIKGILIDPDNRTISETVVGAPFLSSIYAVLQCDVVEACHIDEKNSIWLDEEGLFKAGNPAFMFIEQGFVGKAVILGDLGDRSCDTTVTVDQVKKWVGWTNKVAAP